MNGREEAVTIPVGPARLAGDLSVPPAARGIVLFAHGSGSSRFSPRNRSVAQALRVQRFATLLADLLTPAEETVDIRTGEFRFNIALLGERLIGLTDWLGKHSVTDRLAMGYFGASTGAGAALIAAAERPEAVRAVVSRGGRPDLAGVSLQRVLAPTLLIVGGNDLPVIGMNQEALEQLAGAKRLEIVPGAGHLFEEPGALDTVTQLASQWFTTYLEV